MIKALLFDLGDTIFNPDWISLDKSMIKEAGISIIMPPHLKKIYGEEVLVGRTSMESLFKTLLNNYKKNAPISDVVAVYKRNYQKYSPINDKMIKLIDRLRTKVKVYALSNTNTIHREVNEQRGLFNHFEKSFLSCELGMRKPDVFLYKFILEYLKIQPSELLFIDDNQENIEIAKSLSIKTVKYENYESLISELKKFNIC